MSDLAVEVPAETVASPRRPKRRNGRVVVYTLLILFAALYLMPFLVMVSTSLKSMDEIRDGNLLALPRDPSFAAWAEAWGSACIGVTCEGLKGFFYNSLVMVIPAVTLSCAFGAINGYILTKLKFRGANLLFGLILFGCFIPFQIVLLPMARTLGILGLAGTVPGLVMVHVVYGISFTTLFFRNYFQTFPDDLIKSARVDGAGFFTTFFRIVLPTAWPIVVVSLIWQFTGIWNDFLFGASYTAAGGQPMTVALNNLVNTSTGTKAYNVDMAGAILAALPTILVYVVAGRFFLRGLMTGAVKG